MHHVRVLQGSLCDESQPSDLMLFQPKAYSSAFFPVGSVLKVVFSYQFVEVYTLVFPPIVAPYGDHLLTLIYTTFSIPILLFLHIKRHLLHCRLMLLENVTFSCVCEQYLEPSLSHPSPLSLCYLLLCYMLVIPFPLTLFFPLFFKFYLHFFAQQLEA